MKIKIAALACFCLFFTLLPFPHSSGSLFPGSVSEDDIVGKWWNGEKDAHIRIFKAINQKYSGKLEWMKSPNDENGNPKVDDQNPNPKLRNQPRLGLIIMKNFSYNSREKVWKGGTIYDPKTGKTYDAIIRMEGSNKLFLRGYVLGMTWLGKTAEWERVQ